MIKASNTVPSVYKEEIEICSIELEQYSDYLVVGCTSASASINEQVSCLINITSGQNASFFGLNNTRTDGLNGGGVINSVLISTTSQKITATLKSYGYSNTVCNIKGYLFAIKLK